METKCANCTEDAHYVYQIAENTKILYCTKHLPKFLQNAKKAGLLQTTDSFVQAVNDVKEKINAPVTPEPTVAPTSEPDPTPEPEAETAPVKKAAVKKTAK
jgi:hypothetical protein